MKVCATFVFLSLFSAAFTQSVGLAPSVSASLDKAQACAAEGRWAEAQARAEALLNLRPVRYSVEAPSAAVARALDVWAGKVGIEFVAADAQTADLRIVFRQSLTMAGRPVMGLANVRRKFHHWGDDSFTVQTSATLEVSTMDPFGLPVRDDVVTNVVLHEVGHFLGLEDSFGRDCVMGPINLDRPLLAPSPLEVDCLIQLRLHAQRVMDMAALSARGQ